MMSQDPNGVQIEQIHTGAICKEIGERLRVALGENPKQLPHHILGLTERFDSLELGNAAFRASIGMGAK